MLLLMIAGGAAWLGCVVLDNFGLTWSLPLFWVSAMLVVMTIARWLPRGRASRRAGKRSAAAGGAGTGAWFLGDFGAGDGSGADGGGSSCGGGGGGE
ncbi:hypothetical protein [Nocardia carnea]|uniref:hypothetical protein n=1 Tax=Nocardia carnea TaxID=37328 RepID=UPI00068B917F|nr:hypothetical protein [Nocardia carnea]